MPQSAFGHVGHGSQMRLPKLTVQLFQLRRVGYRRVGYTWDTTQPPIERKSIAAGRSKRANQRSDGL